MVVGQDADCLGNGKDEVGAPASEMSSVANAESLEA